MLDLARQLKESILEEQLIPLFNLNEEVREKFKENNLSFPTKEQVMSLAESMQVDPKHLYYVNREMGIFCYYNFPTYMTIDVMNGQFIEELRIPERIKSLIEVTRESVEKNDIYSLFVLTEDAAKILLFNKLYWMAPNEEKFDMYREIYSMLDYGHGAIHDEIRRDVWKHQSESDKREVRYVLDHLQDGDKITVYRGEGSRSTTHDLSMSWTTSLNVAAFFATRFQSDLDVKVYKAKIRKDLVLDYNDDLKEQEVSLFPENLEQIEELPMVTLKTQLDPFQNEGYIEEYFLYKNTYMKGEHYRHPRGIHGVGHVKHVLFHALELSRAMGLSHSDRAILANASVYHDIGRKHDGHCTMHGYWSWTQFKNTIKPHHPLMAINCVQRHEKGETGYDLSLLNKDEEDIVRFLIEYHCRNDEDGQNALRKKHLHVNTRERYWRLFLIFKDCDGLDRVRLPLNELDVSFFRTEEAKERIVLAYQVQNITQQL